jgi:hypothetical protein
MKIVSASIVFVLLAAPPEVRYLRYQRPVRVPEQQAGQACFAVEPEIFAHAAPQLADLRLYAGDAETPYVVREAVPTAGTERQVPLLNAGVRNGQTVFDAELPEGHYSDVTLAVTAHDFIATVTVTGSRDASGKQETKLGEYTIFDLSKQRLGRSTVLHLPESTMPYLHFRIAGPLKPEDVTALSAGWMPEAQPRYRTVAETVQATQKDRSTVVEFNLPAHVPVDRVVFVPGPLPASFSRDVTVGVQEVEEKRAGEQNPPPFEITNAGSLLRVHKVQDGKRIDEERLVVDAPREFFNAPSKWTVKIANGDDVPLSLKSVRLEMLERTLCFDAAAGGAYTLRYGDAALSAPQYDYARLFSRQANALQASVGPEQLNPGWQARPDERPFTEKHPTLLWVALVAVVALLGAIALRAQKRSPAGT